MKAKVEWKKERDVQASCLELRQSHERDRYVRGDTFKEIRKLRPVLGGMTAAIELEKPREDLSMKRILRNVLVISSVLMTAQNVGITFAGDGGSEGGTNTDKKTLNAVEFEKTGQLVRIDPTQFEGLYQELKPRIDTLEQKIPGLGAELKRVMTEKSWFVTSKEFDARQETEEQPINQNETHVYLTGQKLFYTKNREQLKQYFLHELVRGLVMNNHTHAADPSDADSERRRSLSQAEIDKMVEGLSVVLYYDYDRPESQLASLINQQVGESGTGRSGRNAERSGWLSREAIMGKIREYGLKQRFDQLCKVFPESFLSQTKSKLNHLQFDQLPKVSDLSPEVRKKLIGALDGMKSNADFKTWDPLSSRYRSIFNDASGRLPVNRVKEEDSLSTLDQFQWQSSVAISGKRNCTDCPSLSEDDRLSFLVSACNMLTQTEVDMLSWEPTTDKKAEDQPQTIREAMEILLRLNQSQGTQNPAAAESDSRLKPATQPSGSQSGEASAGSSSRSAR